MADWSVIYYSFRLAYANFSCMNFDSTIFDEFVKSRIHQVLGVKFYVLC